MSQQATSWVQVISQLRNGVKLKATGVGESARKPIEYKLTPYEMLMDDIRSGRNKLRQVMVDGTPPRVKKDAPAVILEFIRCRPLLRKVFIPFSFVCLFLPRAPCHAFVIVIDLLSIFLKIQSHSFYRKLLSAQPSIGPMQPNRKSSSDSDCYVCRHCQLLIEKINYNPFPTCPWCSTFHSRFLTVKVFPLVSYDKLLLYQRQQFALTGLQEKQTYIN